MTIKQNIEQILSELPDGVELVAAAKTRTAEEVLQALESGVTIIGENYVQEAERSYANMKLSGSAGGRVEAPVTEETPKEYAAKVMAGEI